VSESRTISLHSIRRVDPLGFNPDEPRDKDGKWTGGSSGNRKLSEESSKRYAKGLDIRETVTVIPGHQPVTTIVKPKFEVTGVDSHIKNSKMIGVTVRDNSTGHSFKGEVAKWMADGFKRDAADSFGINKSYYAVANTKMSGQGGMMGALHGKDNMVMAKAHPNLFEEPSLAKKIEYHKKLQAWRDDNYKGKPPRGLSLPKKKG
jgi:hypothetical protein